MLIHLYGFFAHIRVGIALLWQPLQGVEYNGFYLRLIYARFETDERIVLVELYHKNEKENEDRARIVRNFK